MDADRWKTAPAHDAHANLAVNGTNLRRKHILCPPHEILQRSYGKSQGCPVSSLWIKKRRGRTGLESALRGRSSLVPLGPSKRTGTSVLRPPPREPASRRPFLSLNDGKRFLLLLKNEGKC